MSRAATSRLKVNPPLGRRPSLEFRRVDELQIDPSYQRSIAAAASQTLIRRIAQFWDWSLCQPLTVAKREDGTLFVVDGQHRLEAAGMRRDIEDLPCVVTAYPNAGDEAAAFVALNQQRRPLGKIDLFKAALAAEDDVASDISRLLTEAGLQLAPHTNYSAWKPGMVSNIAGITDCYRRHGERVTGLALRALARGFAGQVLRYAGSLFPGISATVVQELRFEGKVDVELLAAALGQRSQADWKQEIALEQAAAGVDRILAAKKVVALAYRAQALPAARATAPQADPLPPEMTLWCDQCDQRVSGAKVNRCTDRFCKARAVAA